MVEGLSNEGKTLKIGLYKHYKGTIYEVIGVGHHTETEEELVFYKDTTDNPSLWARPLDMFIETITFEGKIVPRFSYFEQLA